MKKYLVILLSICLVLGSLAGCSGNKESATQDVEEWPKDKITVVIPFAAGGSADTMARGLIKYWEQELGVPMVIENREGASSQVGITYYSKLPADGNSILIGTQLYLSSTIALQNADYDIDDFAMINFQQIDPVTITVHNDSPYQTFDDLINAIKENPGQLKFGTIFGGPLHIASEILKEELDLDYKTVFYDSGNAFRTALLGKHVDFIFGQVNGDLALKGNARVLAVAGERTELWPDSPTFNEVLAKYNKGFPLLGSSRYIAVHSEVKENYPERFEKLVETYKKAFENPEYQEILKNSGELEVSGFYGPEESDRINLEMHELVIKYKDKLQK